MPKPAPTSADALLKALQQAHADLAAELLRLREQALARGQVTTWTMQFVESRMALVEQTIAEVSAGVLGPAGKFGLAAETVQQAYAVGLKVATKSLVDQGAVGLVAPAMTDLHKPAMLAIAQEMTDGYQGFYQAVLRKENDAYRRLQGHFTQVALATGETGSELTGRLVKEFVNADMAEGGVMVGLKRKWKSEDYAEMLGRTVAQKAMREAGLNRITETGHDYVLVIGSDSARTCDTCDWANGRVFSVSGGERPPGMSDEKWGGPLDLLKAERSATRDRKVGAKNSPPLGHPRCGHDYGAYIPETTPEEDIADLQAALEEYAGDLGMTITGGQAA